ncbi:TPA: helix-turn-helix transcriptional regulator [Neisseria meningitidis]
MENELVEFGKRVKHYRLLNGWSQEELAEKVGLHRTYEDRPSSILYLQYLFLIKYF